jgi:hypothetical protein
MRYLDRALGARLLRLTTSFPIVVVSGARQVGKTTLVRHVLGDWEVVTLDPAIDIANARSEPDLFLSNFPPPLVLDEIQYAPELVAALKRRVDADRAPGQYVLTGSQQWQVLRSARESLAGRAVFLDLEGFSLHELGGRANTRSWLIDYLESPREFTERSSSGHISRLPVERTLSEQLWRGFLPEAQEIELELVGDLLEAYFRTYVERDIRTLADVSDWQQFGRFTQLLAALTGQEINRSQLGRELGMTPQTATRWRDMLTATFQWQEMPPYSGNAIKRISKRAKGHISDTGLACYLQRVSSPQALAGHPLFGALFETAVVAEVRKLVAAASAHANLYHWRTHGGAEVDLVLERDGTLFPIEIKLTARPSASDAGGITAFRRAYPAASIAPGLVLCACERPLMLTKDDLALPWDAD